MRKTEKETTEGEGDRDKDTVNIFVCLLNVQVKEIERSGKGVQGG